MILFRSKKHIRSGYFNVWVHGGSQFSSGCHPTLQSAMSSQYGARPMSSRVGYRIRVKVKGEHQFIERRRGWRP